MNNAATLSFLRAILKIGAGYFVAQGFMNESQAEVISAGLVGLAAVIWGIWHRTPPGPLSPPNPPAPGGPPYLLALAFLCAGLAGCANLSSKTLVIHPDGTREETRMWGYALGGADNALAKFHNSPVSMTSSNGWALPAGTTIGTATQAAQAPSVNLGEILGAAMKAYTGKP